jgi:alkylation response protein AidB-like acyl-CoA dehydrogenase
MRLDLDPLQHEFARAVAAIRPDSAWDDLARIGAFAFGLSLDIGGLDLGLGAQVVVEAALGASLRPIPGYHDTLLAADVVAALSGPGVAELGEAFATGGIRAAADGIHNGPCGWLDDADRLHGVSGLLADAPWSLIVVRTQRAGGPGHDGPDVLAVVDPGAGGCTGEPVETLAGPALRLTFTGAPCLIVSTARPELKPALAAARVRQAAYLSGIARAACDAAAHHACRRVQFGQRLIEFQTVGHRLAMLVAEGDGLDLLIHEAAWRIDTARPAAAHAPQVLAAAAEHAFAATRLAVQLHGARGIVADSTPAAAYRLAAVEGLRLGTPDSLWREAGLHCIAGRDQWDDETPAGTSNFRDEATIPA